VRFSSLALVPRDPLSILLGWALRLLAAALVMTVLLGLAGLHRPEVPIERVGRGAEMVVLLDRSRSMDDVLRPTGGQLTFTGGPGESKGMLARRLLAEFAAQRESDLVAMILFSASPIPVLPFTQRQEMIQAAIAAGGIGRGLSETDIGRALLAAAAMFDQRPYSGSRLILLVSDGGAQLEPDMRERITNQLKRNRIALYWIYIRSPIGGGLKPTPGESEASANAPERTLHAFFESIGTPYHAYEAHDPDALARAIADVARLENSPIHYSELQPRRDLTGTCYALAAATAMLLVVAACLRVRHWP
jgi:mxaC protein